MPPKQAPGNPEKDAMMVAGAVKPKKPDTRAPAIAAKYNKAPATANKQVEAVKKYVLAKIDPLPADKCQAHADRMKADKDFANCEVNSEKVVTILTGFHLVQKKLMDPKLIDSAVKKLSDWIESSPGNDEEAARLYFLQQLMDVLNDPQNDELDEVNVLMSRLAFYNMKDHETNEPVFNFFEVLCLTCLCLDQAEMN
jgi:hypothetical protein